MKNFSYVETEKEGSDYMKLQNMDTRSTVKEQWLLGGRGDKHHMVLV